MVETLADRQADMKASAEREDYTAAATARDACHQLELQQRTLQLALDHHQRSTILHSLGMLLCSSLVTTRPLLLYAG